MAPTVAEMCGLKLGGGELKARHPPCHSTALMVNVRRHLCATVCHCLPPLQTLQGCHLK